MRYILKGEEPQGLVAFKSTPGVDFSCLQADVKNELKVALVQEQGYICCYCGKRIACDHDTVLEHLLCQDLHSSESLTYNNILASCDGGQKDRCGKPKREKKKYPSHCDDSKGSESLDVSPLCPECEALFIYDDDGNITGVSDVAERAISILGLNCSTVKNGRAAAITAYKEMAEYQKQYGDTEISWADIIQKNKEKDDEGKLPEYCFASVYYIEHFCL